MLEEPTAKKSPDDAGGSASRSSIIAAIAFAFATLLSLPAPAKEPASCQTVRFSDIGWTDVTATTGLTSHLLRRLGYKPVITVLSVPVTYASLKNKDIDIYMGNWMPAQDLDSRDYIAEGSVEVVGANLAGAKYTLAVPAYLFDAGLHDFADIQRFAPQLKHAIYGIEPGNDGNRLVLTMIKTNEFGLGSFKLVESSEQGMLAQVVRAYAARQPIVFLGWEPHPMNTRFEMRYLTGGDSSFGPNYGGATIFTNTRAGYSQECPNVGRLLKNLKFSLRGENELMSGILDQKLQPEEAAAQWLKANPDALKAWFAGVQTFDGRPALEATVEQSAARQAVGFEPWITGHKIPLGRAIATGIEFIKAHGSAFFAGVSFSIHGAIGFGELAAVGHACPIVDPARGRARLAFASLHRPGRLRDRRFALHHESGVLGGHARDPVAGLRVGARLHIARCAHRHRRRAPPPAEFGTAPGARPDADPADFRLPHPNLGAFRPGCGSGPDLNCDLRVAGAHSPDAARYLIGADRAARSG